MTRYVFEGTVTIDSLVAWMTGWSDSPAQSPPPLKPCSPFTPSQIYAKTRARITKRNIIHFD